MNSVGLHLFNRCPWIDQNSSKFHRFSSCLKQMDDHHMKIKSHIQSKWSHFQVFSVVLPVVMRPRPILYRISLGSDPHFRGITQRTTDVMWVDRYRGVVENRLMVNPIQPIFFLSSRFGETRLTPKSPWNVDSGAGRHWSLSSESSCEYTNTVTTHFSHCHDIVHDENTFLRF